MSMSSGKNDFVFVIFNYFDVVVGSWCYALLSSGHAGTATRSGLHCRRSRVLVISTVGDVLLRALPEKISFFRVYLRSIDYIFL